MDFFILVLFLILGNCQVQDIILLVLPAHSAGYETGGDQKNGLLRKGRAYPSQHGTLFSGGN